MAGKSENRIRSYLLGRVKLAEELGDHPSAIWGDRALILCTVLSACAATKWPGSGFDHKRFVELLTVESPPTLLGTWVSLPAMVRKRTLTESDTPLGQPRNAGRIWRDVDIDADIETTQTRYPLISRKELQTCSYASLIYQWLRCAYVHEYKADLAVTPVPASKNPAKISYIGRGTEKQREWMVAISIDYLFELAQYHAEKVIDIRPAKPAAWWLVD